MQVRPSKTNMCLYAKNWHRQMKNREVRKILWKRRIDLVKRPLAYTVPPIFNFHFILGFEIRKIKFLRFLWIWLFDLVCYCLVIVLSFDPVQFHPLIRHMWHYSICEFGEGVGVISLNICRIRGMLGQYFSQGRMGTLNAELRKSLSGENIDLGCPPPWPSLG